MEAKPYMKHVEGTHIVFLSFIVVPINGIVGESTGLDGS